MNAPMEAPDTVAFLLRATQEIPRVFGPDVAYSLALFQYPDEPEHTEYHLVIDSPLPRAEASERLDQLCDEWWDAAAAELRVELFPVLGVVDRA
jgi:hypothetical protein